MRRLRRGLQLEYYWQAMGDVNVGRPAWEGGLLHETVALLALYSFADGCAERAAFARERDYKNWFP